MPSSMGQLSLLHNASCCAPCFGASSCALGSVSQAGSLCRLGGLYASSSTLKSLRQISEGSSGESFSRRRKVIRLCALSKLTEKPVEALLPSRESRASEDNATFIVAPVHQNHGASRSKPARSLVQDLAKILDFRLQERLLLPVLAFSSAAMLLGVPVAEGTDALKVCQCLLKNCRVELAKCIGDPKCAANIACLQTCNNRPDEVECQIKCGDLFANSVVDDFNRCAVSEKGCVPQKPDENRFPVPPPSAVVQSFDMRDFNGRWYISSGLNPSFDVFDCQLHEFSATKPDNMIIDLKWRVNTPDGGFLTRSAQQRFVRDEKQEGLLLNHDNEFLHYQDDWYIIAAQTDNKPDDFVFVYYKGTNDAWDGYGGAVIYTRARTVPESIVPQLEEAAKKVGLNYSSFIATNNTCPPQLPLFLRVEKKVEGVMVAGGRKLVEAEQEVAKKVTEVAETEVKLLKKLGKGVQEVIKDEEIFLKSLAEEELALLNKLKGMGMEATDIGEVLGKPVPIRKLR